jgi:hypothetical protein
MSDSYNYNFYKILTERSIDIIDTKSLLTYGMIGITTVVLAVATLYDQEEDSNNEENLLNILSKPNSEEVDNEVFPENEVENKSIMGGKNKTNKKSRRTKRKISKK